MRITLLLPLCLFLVTGCHHAPRNVLGKPPRGPQYSILSIKAGTTPPQVCLRGVMIEKCPVAGCWFRLRDSTGVIKVDTKAAGFVVVNVPVQQTLTVAGKVALDGDDVVIQASGIRY
ncbi:MAG: hypothetical protein KGS61_08840 [Verrucomicrobia bacterium]|nr:hypothetical protein [Verrucomicrobiota bacterium]